MEVSLDGLDDPGSGDERWVESDLKGFTRLGRQVFWQFKQAFRFWIPIFERFILCLVLAAIVGIVDRKLLKAWQEDGLSVLRSYVPMMLYVYVSMFFDRRLVRLPKLLVIGAAIYGVIKTDLFPDRKLEYLIDDLVLIVIAARVFVAMCPEQLTLETARRALRWKERTQTLRTD